MSDPDVSTKQCLVLFSKSRGHQPPQLGFDPVALAVQHQRERPPTLPWSPCAWFDYILRYRGGYVVGVVPSLLNRPTIWWLQTNGEGMQPTAFADLLLLAPFYL